MVVKWGKTDMPRAQDGAAAVEFALVSALLFTVLFGILQYGLYFNDSLNVRQGVREAARLGVVENFGYTGCTGTNGAKMACLTKAQIGNSAGTPLVKITVQDPATGAGTTWAKGMALVVCAALKSNGANGIVPIPNSGWVTSKTQLSIEQEVSKATWANPTADTLPSGVSWPTGC
jgi:hypothetical protein